MTPQNSTKLHKPRKCIVCRHPRCAEFDKALVAGTMSKADVAKEVGCDRSSVYTHFNKHVLPVARTQLLDAVSVAETQLIGIVDIDVLGELRSLFHRMKGHLERAEEANDLRAIKAFVAPTGR